MRAWTGSSACAQHRILEFAPTAERPFVLGLPTGSSPVKTYERLVQYYKKGELSFRCAVEARAPRI